MEENYHDRRKMCEDISKKLDVKWLRCLSWRELEGELRDGERERIENSKEEKRGKRRILLKCSFLSLSARKSELNDVEFKRAAHAVKEIERSLQSKEVLKNGNYQKFGELMSHLTEVRKE